MLKVVTLLLGSPLLSQAATLIWPKPTNALNGEVSIAVDPNFEFVFNQRVKTLDDAAERYLGLLFPYAASKSTPEGSSSSILKLVVDVVDSSEDFPQYGTDESYKLSVNADGTESTLTANTIYGVLRGLETFSQLVYFDQDTGVYFVDSAPWQIEDEPRFSHRGILLDTSRHFQPLSNLKRFLDAMSYAKLNVFHWHLSDSQSFPYQSTTYPKLWEGSYSSYERYRQDDIREIVEYARERGIRVMAEFDVPGHAGSWCEGYPEICPSLFCKEPLNPASNTTFEVVDSLIEEVAGVNALFPDQFVHLGGDEVNTDCWSDSRDISRWMDGMGYTPNDAYKYFVDRAAQMVIDRQHNPVQWVEVYENFGDLLKPETIVHIWKAKSTLADVVASGYRALLSDNDLWYLDHLSTTWDMMYNNEPLDGITDETQRSLLLGGEACMWGETVDASDLDNTVWPRAAAVSERLWTAVDQIDSTDDALERLETFRCLLNRRGVGAAPVENAQARNSPPSPGSCYDQRRRR